MILNNALKIALYLSAVLVLYYTFFGSEEEFSTYFRLMILVLMGMVVN